MNRCHGYHLGIMMNPTAWNYGVCFVVRVPSLMMRIAYDYLLQTCFNGKHIPVAHHITCFAKIVSYPE